MRAYPIRLASYLMNKVTSVARGILQKRQVVFEGDPAIWKQISAGMGVSNETAMQKTVVYSCVRILVTKISSLPLSVMQKLPEGGSRVAFEHPLYNVLHNQPNKMMSTVEYNQFVMQALSQTGNAFIFKFIGNGLIKELIPMVGSVEIRFRKSKPGAEREFYYRFTSNSIGISVDLERHEVLHFRYMSMDGIRGRSPLQVATDVVEASVNLNDYASLFFKNGANLGTIVTMKVPEGNSKMTGIDDDDTRTKYRKEMEQAWSGNDNAHKLGLIPYDFDISHMGVNPKESQAIEQRGYTDNGIAALYGIPKHMLNLGDPKYSNAEESNRQFMKGTIGPYLILQEKRMDLDLLSEANRTQGYFIKFNIDAEMRGDPKTQAEVLKILVKEVGVMTINEARAIQDRPPVEGGDELWTQMQYVTLKSQLELLDSNNSEDGQRRLSDHSEQVRAMVQGYLKEEVRVTSGQLVRNRIRSRFEPIYEDVFGQVTSRETKALDRNIKKYIASGDLTAFRAWMDEFYPNLDEFIQKKFRTSLDAYSDAIGAAALAEAGSDELEEKQRYQEFVNAYLISFAGSWADYSSKQLNTILDDNEEDQIAGKLQAKSDYWKENRANTETRREIVNGDNAFAIFTWVLVGITRKVWINQGEPCPFCEQMAGRTVSILSSFIKQNSVLTDPTGNKDNMTITQNVGHPQLHGGCVCGIGIG